MRRLASWETCPVPPLHHPSTPPGEAAGGLVPRGKASGAAGFCFKSTQEQKDAINKRLVWNKSAESFIVQCRRNTTRSRRRTFLFYQREKHQKTRFNLGSSVISEEGTGFLYWVHVYCYLYMQRCIHLWKHIMDINQWMKCQQMIVNMYIWINHTPYY